ncbi:Uncharacterised protein [Mycobacteroides abscessus subsp. massiliense]|nr:Uncharacterised protein [Mycobacteroides abscessus subsp. massiliense]SKR81756.1 Uncharacterised protein [Mycobacteroides abscessus subsp. massiliense]SKU06770.1 Uncharacterised protein [Mycobacteroides abscessus subsp. massiliense]SKU22008.1 Uncharacterised protein [Mycobacteroides abscessus subsp. massiliense]SKZ94306.1 Uncharacterised protein [Mycobacteroides abscessus subsp. massiliense]
MALTVIPLISKVTAGHFFAPSSALAKEPSVPSATVLSASRVSVEYLVRASSSLSFFLSSLTTSAQMAGVTTGSGRFASSFWMAALSWTRNLPFPSG